MKQTYNPCDECDYSYSKNNQIMKECDICEFNQYMIKCIKYETLEEEGKLLKLPVALGSTIYIIRYKWTNCSYHGHGFDDYDCQGCVRELDEWCDSHKIYYVDSTKAELVDIIRYMDSNLFGDTVFASEEEAEERCKYLNICNE